MDAGEDSPPVTARELPLAQYWLSHGMNLWHDELEDAAVIPAVWGSAGCGERRPGSHQTDADSTPILT